MPKNENIDLAALNIVWHTPKTPSANPLDCSYDPKWRWVSGQSRGKRALVCPSHFSGFFWRLCFSSLCFLPPLTKCQDMIWDSKHGWRKIRPFLLAFLLQFLFGSSHSRSSFITRDLRRSTKKPEVTSKTWPRVHHLAWIANIFRLPGRFRVYDDLISLLSFEQDQVIEVRTIGLGLEWFSGKQICSQKLHQISRRQQAM